jgi:hypothetical protein
MSCRIVLKTMGREACGEGTRTQAVLAALPLQLQQMPISNLSSVANRDDNR